MTLLAEQSQRSSLVGNFPPSSGGGGYGRGMPHFSQPVFKSVSGANAPLRRCLVLLAGIAAAFGLVACASEVNGACGVVVDSVSGGPVGGVGVSVVLGVDAPAGRVDAVRAETVTGVDGTWCLGPVDAAVVDDWTVFVDGVAVGYESGWSSRLGDDGGLLDGLLFNVDVWDNAVSVGEGPDPVALDGVEFRLDPIGPAVTSVPPTSVPPTSVPPTSVPPTSVPPTTVPPTTVPPTTVPPTQPIIESLTSGVGDIGACSEGEGTSVWATVEISGTGADDEVTVEVTWTSDAVEAPTTGSRSETKIGGGPHRVYVGAFDADYRFSTLTVTMRVVAESGLSDEASFTRDVDYPDGDRCTYG